MECCAYFSKKKINLINLVNLSYNHCCSSKQYLKGKLDLDTLWNAVKEVVITSVAIFYFRFRKIPACEQDKQLSIENSKLTCTSLIHIYSFFNKGLKSMYKF
jgi:hypothetical protein